MPAMVLTFTMQGFFANSHRLPIQRKLLGFTALIGLGIVAFLIFFYQSFSVSLEDERKAQTKNLSASAMGVIRYFYNRALSGELEQSDAQRYAMSALRSATYGDNGYFWINSGEGELLMQPYTPERVGINQIDWTDGNGQFIFREFIDKAKEGGGWVTYHWPKPKSQDEFHKISYVAYFSPWDWVLGTGVYLYDMESNIFWIVAQASGILCFSFVTFVMISIFVVNYFIRQLGDLAVRDALTEMYTKRFLSEIMPSVLNKHERLKTRVLAALFMDIDYFKKVNDEYGHDWGDKVIKQVAAVILQNTRPDDYCIRYGGEEFLVIGFFNDESSAVRVADRIRIEVSQLLFGDNRVEFRVTLSAGVAAFDRDRESFEETINRADQKLYHSKEAGRNRVSS